MKKLNKKQEKQFHMFVRSIIQILFFVGMPSIYTVCFSGLKAIFIQLGGGQLVTINSFVAAFVAISIYTVVFGRFFCGYVCSFGALNDWVRGGYVALCKKCKKKPITLFEKWEMQLRYVKYFVLGFVLLAYFTGWYDKLQGISCWDVFSRLRIGKWNLQGYLIGAILLFLVVLGMIFCERFFCRFLCPMGAFFSLLPMSALFTVHRRKAECLVGCSACKKMCPMHVDIPEPGEMGEMGECLQCGKCMHICPKGNVKACTCKNVGVEVAFILVRVILLVVLMKYVGV